MAEKRAIRAKDIVNDLRTGMTNAQLAEKYEVSAIGLAGIFTNLIDSKAVRGENWPAAFHRPRTL